MNVMTKDGYLSSSELAAATGVSYRRIDYWARNGIITPIIEAKGSGSPRGWAPAIVDAIIAMDAVSAALGVGHDRNISIDLLALVGQAVLDGKNEVCLDGGVCISWQ